MAHSLVSSEDSLIRGLVDTAFASRHQAKVFRSTGGPSNGITIPESQLQHSASTRELGVETVLLPDDCALPILLQTTCLQWSYRCFGGPEIKSTAVSIINLPRKIIRNVAQASKSRRQIDKVCAKKTDEPRSWTNPPYKP